MKYKYNRKSLVLNSVNSFFLLIILAAMLYPFIYVLSISLSNSQMVMAGLVKLLPKGFTLDSYKYVLQDTLLFSAYLNTIYYAALSTVIVSVTTVLTSYPLAVKSFAGKKFYTIYLTATLFFSGGLIPLYIVITRLNMINSVWAMVLPGAVSVWNILICRTFFQEIPYSLRESALIDGANDIQILFKVYVPLSKAIMATIALYTIVGQWNNFFSALIFLNDRAKYPLQMVIRRMLVNMEYSARMGRFISESKIVSSQSIRCATIIISILPIVFIYPSLQKYFIKGVLIGSVKG